MIPPSAVLPALALLAAHALVDFVVQNERDVREKAALRPLAFVRHGAQHALAAWILVGVVSAWTIPLAVFGAHVTIDAAKELARRRVRGDATGLRLFTLDQIAHIASIVAIAALLGASLGPSSWETWIGRETWTTALIVATGLIVAVRTGAIVVALGVRRFQRDLDEAEPADTIRTEPRGLSGGGAMIGALERALVFFFVLTGMPQAVGFLLAAKSILRFGDLNARQQRVETEYVIIGTLASFAWALATAWLTTRALAHFG